MSTAASSCGSVKSSAKVVLMNNDKLWFWVALVAFVIIAVCVSQHYETFEASLSAGPIKLDLKAGNATTTLVNLPLAANEMAASV